MRRCNYDYLFHSQDQPAETWRQSAPLPELAKALKEYRTERLNRTLESIQTAEKPYNAN